MTVVCDKCKEVITINDVKDGKALVNYNRNFDIIFEALCEKCLLMKSPDVPQQPEKD